MKEILSLLPLKLLTNKCHVICFLALNIFVSIPFMLEAQNPDINSSLENKVIKRIPTEANQGVAVDENYYTP